MRQSTLGLLLVAFVAAAGGALLLSDLGFRRGARTESFDPLERLRPDRISGLTVRVDGQPPEEAISLVSGAGGWTMPGNWPVRQGEARELVDLVGNLRTRFAPEVLSGGKTSKELAKRGLSPAQVELKITFSSGGDMTLELGEEQTGDGNSFNRPVWARLDASPDLLRLSPGALTVLRRPASFYRQRRLFAVNTDAARKTGVRPPGENATPVAPVLAKSLEMRSDVPPKDEATAKDSLLGTLRLDRDEPAAGNPVALAAAWRVNSSDGKTRLDRLDPTAGDVVLNAVPEIWAERFYFGNAAAPAKTGLDKPGRTLVVTDTTGRVTRLMIGKKSRERAFKRMVAVTPPPGLPPGMNLPPREETVREDFLFAQLTDNPQVFEVRADKVELAFASRAKLRDAKLARFKVADVEKVQVSGPGFPEAIVLAKVDGKWRLEGKLARLADGARVEALIGKLESLEAREADVVEPEAKDLAEALKTAGLDQPRARVELTVREDDPAKPAPKEGDPVKWTRGVVYEVGGLDAGTNKLAVRSEGLPRINRVENGAKDQPDNQIAAMVVRKAGDYRSTQLFDINPSEAVALTIDQGGKKTVLKREKGKPWMLETPPGEADAGEVERLLTAVAGARASEFVADGVPADKQASEYGLGATATSVTVNLAPEGKPARVARLVIGKNLTGKASAFGKAELDGVAGGDKPGVATVVALTPEARPALERDSAAFIPKALWNVAAKDITALVVKRPDGSEYRLMPQAPAITPNLEAPEQEVTWKIQGPFEATANAQAQALARALLAPVARRWVSLADSSLAERGLDKPLTVRVELKTGPARVLMLGKVDPTAKEDEQPGAAPGADKPALGRFAKMEGKAGVLVVDGPLASAVDRAALELVTVPSSVIDPAKIQKVELKQAGKSFVVERSTRGGWQLLGLGDFTAPVTEGGTRRLEESLANPNVSRLAAYGKEVDARAKEFGLDTPRVDALATLLATPDKKEPQVKRLRLGADLKDQPGTYARLDDELAVVVVPSDVTRALLAGATDYLPRRLLPVAKLEATRLSRSGKAGNLSMERDGPVWKAKTGPAIDSATVTYMLESMEGLEAQSAEAWQPTWLQADLVKFGLDQPEAIWLLEGTLDGKPTKRLLQVGKIADKARGTRFVRADGELVGRLQAEIATKLVAPSLYFQDRTVARIDGMSEAKVTTAGRSLRFKLEAGRWRLVEPVAADADPSLAVWLGQFAPLRAGDWLGKTDSPEERKALGLEKPASRWEFLDAAGKSLGVLETAEIGVDGQAVAALSGKPMLFRLDVVQTAQAVAEYRIRQVYDPPFDSNRVRRVVLTPADGKAFTLLQVGPLWMVEGEPKAKVDPATLRETLMALSNLRLSRYVSDKGAKLADYGLDKPHFSLAIGNNRLLIGGPVGKGPERYAMLESGEASVFVIDKRAVDLLARPLARFALPPDELPAPTPPPAGLGNLGGSLPGLGGQP